MPDIFDSSKQAAQSNPEPKKTLTDSPSQDQPMTETKTSLPTPLRHVDEYSEIMRQSTSSSNIFDAFAPKPQNTAFDSQLANEFVILLLRKHPITQLKYFFITIFLFLIPLLFSYVQIFDFLPTKYQFAGLVLWILLIVGFVLESFLNWFFNCNIITDERVIDVDFSSLIYKNISAAKLDNIEDVTATTGGAIRSMFDFGTIKIQTAAAITEFEFEDVPHPARITTLLNELLLEEERERLEGRVN